MERSEWETDGVTGSARPEAADSCKGGYVSIEGGLGDAEEQGSESRIFKGGSMAATSAAIPEAKEKKLKNGIKWKK